MKNSLPTGTKRLAFGGMIAVVAILFYLWMERRPDDPKGSATRTPALAEQPGLEPPGASVRPPGAAAPKPGEPAVRSGQSGIEPGGAAAAAPGIASTSEPAAVQSSAGDARDPAQSGSSEPRQGSAPSGVTTTIGGRVVALDAPNILGVYPRQMIGIGEAVPVRAVFPEAEPGETVIAAVADGGSLTGNKPVLPLRLDGNRALHFIFNGSREPGLFRVTLRRGLEVKTLEFWAGPPPSYAAADRPPLPIPQR